MSKPQKKISLEVEGMTCAACALSVEKSLNKLESVDEANVNLADHSVRLSFNEKPDFAELKSAVLNAGYNLILPEEAENVDRQAARTDELALKLRKTIATAVIAVLIMALNMGTRNWEASPFIQWALATLALFGFGGHFFSNAWKQARNFKANMDSLVALSTGTAYAFSVFNTVNPDYLASRLITPHLYFEAAVMIIAFIMVGKYLEARATHKTSEALEGLKNLRSDTVLLLENGQEIERTIEEIAQGDQLVVKEGQMIPVDGIIADGAGSVDESLLSGEPLPVEKSEQDEVFEGTVLSAGRIVLEVKEVGSGTMLSQIIDRVRDAQGSKAKVQGLVDKVAGVFVPVIIVLSVITFFAWNFSGADEALSQALVSAISVLVIACPCALGLATPTALMVGIGEAAKQQIIIKDAQSLEESHQLTDLILDKTGTVTEGTPSVEQIIWTPNSESDFHKALLTGVESMSSHPLSKAIVDHLPADLQDIPLTNYEMVRGRGVRAEYVGISYKIGNTDWMIENEVPIANEMLQRSAEFQEAGKTVLYFGGYEKLLALIVLSDKLKADVANHLNALRAMGLELHLYSGDDQRTTEHIAKELNINSFKGNQSPQAKGAFVQKLQSAGRKVGMIGDGINDTEALAQADVSIAMGQGSDIAIDAAQMTLLNGDISKVRRALSLSRLTMKTLRINLFWAFIYNIIGIPIAAGVLISSLGISISPMMAAAAMAFSSISVVMNSLALRNRIDSLRAKESSL